jgi:hypothetical protein
MRNLRRLSVYDIINRRFCYQLVKSRKAAGSAADAGVFPHFYYRSDVKGKLSAYSYQLMPRAARASANSSRFAICTSGSGRKHLKEIAIVEAPAERRGLLPRGRSSSVGPCAIPGTEVTGYVLSSLRDFVRPRRAAGNALRSETQSPRFARFGVKEFANGKRGRT